MRRKKRVSVDSEKGEDREAVKGLRRCAGSPGSWGRGRGGRRGRGAAGIIDGAPVAGEGNGDRAVDLRRPGPIRCTRA
jgi:hypothetical protein